MPPYFRTVSGMSAIVPPQVFFGLFLRKLSAPTDTHLIQRGILRNVSTLPHLMESLPNHGESVPIMNFEFSAMTSSTMNGRS